MFGSIYLKKQNYKTAFLKKLLLLLKISSFLLFFYS